MCMHLNALRLVLFHVSLHCLHTGQEDQARTLSQDFASFVYTHNELMQSCSHALRKVAE